METVGDYRLGRVLGKGGFSEVRLGTHLPTRKQYAIKVLERNSAINSDERIRGEIKAFRRLQHKNVVGYNAHVVTRRRVFICLEYVGGGELYDLLADSVRFTEERARQLFAQVLDGVEYCHSRGVCHRDLKLENLMLASDGTVKITDFGFSKNFARASPRTCQGTALYVAPEVVMNAGEVEYDGEACDVWSLGIILYLLVVGRFPFNRNNKQGVGPSMSQAQKDMYRNTNFRVPSYLSASVVSLLRSILTIDPTQRPTTAQIRAHAWLAPAYGARRSSGHDAGGMETATPRGRAREPTVDTVAATATPPRASASERLDTSMESTPPSEPASGSAAHAACAAAAAADSSVVEWNEIHAEGEESEEEDAFGDESDEEDEEWDVDMGVTRTFERRPDPIITSGRAPHEHLV